MTNTIEVFTPNIGDFSDVPVIEIPFSVGSRVEEGDTLIVLESDKSTLEVPSEYTGTVVAYKVKEGDLVSEGSLLLTLTTEAAMQSLPGKTTVPQITSVNDQQTDDTAKQQPATEAASLTGNPLDVDATSHIYASPSIRRHARNLGVDMRLVRGTGNKKRITREDVEAFVKAKLEDSGSGMTAPGLPDWPSIDYARFGPIERVALKRIARISGPALARNAMLIPHVTHFDKTDITELEEFRAKLNSEALADDARITLLTFAVKAVVAALKTYPEFNSSLDGKELVIKGYWNIGIAVNTPEGLLVPVIADADRKGYREIASEITALAAAARDSRISPTDLQGATFSISSLGGIGGTNFTPIINAPEVAILGLPRAEIQPAWDGTGFQPRLMQPLSLSFDHRVVDGVAAAHFLRHIARLLSDLRRINI
ncbi:branched-chain alpha-keto acid dehydrogenase subunit E2 [Chromatiales bacterium (ex Bugula neritina AB1)]|nr:branched-chain alpha-keto acid dehydrogenase subunit E2 [Chromatiales bacterium (ex Bugula neritina AB1)]